MLLKYPEGKLLKNKGKIIPVWNKKKLVYF